MNVFPKKFCFADLIKKKCFFLNASKKEKQNLEI